MSTSTRVRSHPVVLVLAAVVALTAIAGPVTVEAPVWSAQAAADPAPRAAAREAKSLVIGVDGTTYARLSATGTPEIEALRRAGTTARSNLYAEPMAPTLSGPGWATIFTGVWPDKHRVRDNAFTGQQFAQYPDYLTRLERASSDLDVGAVATWSPIVSSVVGPEVATRVSGGSDAGTTQRAVTELGRPATDSLFVHLDDVDHAGHDHGAASPEYAAALTTADRQVGRLVRAVEARATYAEEDWLVVVTTDHGHTQAGGHGGNSPQERSTFVVARGGGFAAGATRHDLRVVDVAPTVLAHHGVARSASWGLDGRAARDVVPDAFDALRPQLRRAVDETDTGTAGWTPSAPSGWSVDNSAMPTGGTTEWRGWTFATDDFWTSTDRGQGRETNVRSRDVFAVADSDEWDDRTHGAGQFDSTLVSPSWAVAGLSSVALTFTTTYAIDGPQTAQVLVSVDGGAPTQVKAYTAATNGEQRLVVPVPAGARTLRFRFRYTGTNSAFWTVDQVRVFQG